MNIAILTVEEHLYLPALLARLLKERAAQVRGVYLCPPTHHRETMPQLLLKYYRAFGGLNLWRLVWREGTARLRARLGFGRRRGKFYSMRSAAGHYGVPCATVADVNAEEFLVALRQAAIDLVLSISCPQIFKRPLIQLPAKGCLNVHGALLPKYRGLAPSFWMMANGEEQGGVTVFLMNEAIDAGDVLVQEAFPILPDESLEQFILRSRRLHAEALLRAITLVETGHYQTRSLAKEGGSYYSFPTREAYREFRRRGRRMW